MLNPLIREVDERFALGDASHALMAELLTLIFDGRSGGVPGLMAKFHQQGLGYLVESWVTDSTPMPLKPWQLERIFDSGKLSAMANRLGVVRATAGAAACMSLPELVRLLTRGGRRPTHLPGDVSRYLGGCYRSEASAVDAARPLAGSDGFAQLKLTPGLGWIKWALLATSLIAIGYSLLRRPSALNAATPSSQQASPAQAAPPQRDSGSVAP
ncbi:MAG TPA: YidB family protein [Dokdonella sp.]